jgi:hypothetical protein
MDIATGSTGPIDEGDEFTIVHRVPYKGISGSDIRYRQEQYRNVENEQELAVVEKNDVIFIFHLASATERQKRQTGRVSKANTKASQFDGTTRFVCVTTAKEDEEEL